MHNNNQSVALAYKTAVFYPLLFSNYIKSKKKGFVYREMIQVKFIDTVISENIYLTKD